VSLDGATADVHDAFRRVRGSHAYTMRIIEHARALGLPLQINTTVCRRTVGDLPALARQMERYGVVLWALFFLIPVGRAEAGEALDANEIEGVLEWAADLVPAVPFGIKTTEAPHFHRVLAAHGAALTARDRDAGSGGAATPGAMPHGGRGRPSAIGRAGRAVTDGNGFVFIDHLGEICPSGFLPMSAGNVRRDDLVAVYREHSLFQALRDTDRLGGRCGVCEHRTRCGGSRARAFAVTGDPLAEDPGCAYQPAAFRTGIEASAGSAGAGHDVRAIAGGSSVAAPITGSQITDALREVVDPELNLSVVQLGLIYGIAIEGACVRVTMTLTAQGCPLHGLMSDWVREAVLRIPGVERVDVELTFDPPWTPDRMRV
jgi:MoaA/NifB/PqqE/SkfB family radical SAM enzyme/metal-sulfur cluster biosynthetic enzyme